MSSFAEGVLFFSFVLAGYAAWAAFAGGGWRRPAMIASAVRASIALLALLTLLVGLLIRALVARDFSLEYVASYTSRTLPTGYAISALWAGQAGSLLLWAWLLGLFATIVAWRGRRTANELLPAALGVILAILWFFIGVMAYATNPFAPLAFPVADGNGLNPMLQNSGMVMHPPMLFLGYVGFTVPFAFAVASLLAGRADDGWLRATRRWTLFSWAFLTLGILFGMKWAYVELGWGGYWAWDPVENASFMPWLAATAYLHSAMIQERRGMLKIWNHVLVFLTFALTIFGTFLTRSGLVSSVHSFGVSNVGSMFLGFLAVVIAGSYGLLIARREGLRSENHLDALLSRESSFLFNNLLLVGITFAVFWGTIFPVVSEAIRGVKVTVGPPFYNYVNTPIGIALLALTGFCPLLAWRQTSAGSLRRHLPIPVGMGVVTGVALWVFGIRSVAAVLTFSLSVFVLAAIALDVGRAVHARARSHQTGHLRAFGALTMRNKRRYGGYMVHVGAVMIFAGIAGSGAFQRETTLTLLPGASAEFAGYTVHFDGLEDRSDAHAQVVGAKVRVERDERPVGSMFPAKQKFANHDAVSEVDIRQTLREDLYLILSGWDDRERATIRALVIPLVAWIWAGGIVMIAGTAFAAGPDRVRRTILATEGKRIGHGRKEAVHV